MTTLSLLVQAGPTTGVTFAQGNDLGSLESVFHTQIHSSFSEIDTLVVGIRLLGLTQTVITVQATKIRCRSQRLQRKETMLNLISAVTFVSFFHISLVKKGFRCYRTHRDPRQYFLSTPSRPSFQCRPALSTQLEPHLSFSTKPSIKHPKITLTVCMPFTDFIRSGYWSRKCK